MTFIINNNDRRPFALLDDINAFLHYHARGGFQVTEQDVSEEKSSADEPAPEHCVGWRRISHRRLLS
jgi:hypothetical protein